MKKNVSGQKIGCQMVSASDGSAFTGSVTVYVTGDAGTQAAGSVGSGACTHEGNGYHTYAPAQAETNYDLLAFTFVGTGAIPATVQVFTGFPQTQDNAVALSAIQAVTDELPGGGSLTPITDDLDDIQSRLPAALVSGRMDASVGAMAANVLTATAIAADAITAAKVASDVTTEIQSGLATAAALATVAGYIDTEVAAIKAVTDALPNGGALTSLATASALATVDTVVDAIKATTDKLDTTLTSAVGSPGEYQFTADALENAPAGTGGGGGGPSAGTIASAVWDELLSGHSIAGSAGKIVYDNVNATISSRASQTSVDTIDGLVDSILVDTAEIGTAGAGLTALASAANLATLAGYVDTEVGAIKAKTDNLPASPAATGDIPSAASIADAVLDEALSGHTTSGSLGKAISDTDQRGSRTVIRGTVTSGASTTSIPTSAFSPAGASADQFKGRIVVFDNDTVTEALRGEATDITASSNAANPTLTVTALSATPASGDSFSVL